MNWQGWALGEQALFFRQDEPDDGPVELHFQYRDKSVQVATFVSPELAEYAQDFLEMAITEVGRANTALVAKLDG